MNPVREALTRAVNRAIAEGAPIYTNQPAPRPRKRFHVTYDIVTPESAEHADAAERGFMSPGEWHEDMTDSPVGPAFVPIKAEHALTLREAIELIGCVEDGGDGTSYYETDGRDDYETGAHERRAFHLPDNATAASVERVRRLLIGAGLLRPDGVNLLAAMQERGLR